MDLSQYHIVNSLLPINEFGVTDVEERFCFLYTSDPSFRGDTVKILKAIKYSPLITSSTSTQMVKSVGDSILKKSTIKKRITEMSSTRSDVFVYDRLDVMNQYKRVYSVCMGDDRDESDDDDFVPDLKTAKSVLDSMSKTLGMFEDVHVIKDEASDPGTKLRQAARIARERRATAIEIEAEVVDG